MLLYLLYLAIFLLVLGVLIFFHELGHFVAAKSCGIYVDRFSLGMPPRVIGVRLGETDYCLGALPFGGYVRMAGQEDAPLSEEERKSTYGHVPPERWFNNRPRWQRFIVIFAGPAMNLVLAVLLYAIVAAVGAEVPETELDNRIGDVLEDSPAATAPLYAVTETGKPDFSRPPDAIGWRTGDRIVRIDGRTVTNIQDVAISAVLGAGDVLNVELVRQTADGRLQRYISPVEPKDIHNIGQTMFGISPFSTALIGKVTPDEPAAIAGLAPGDIIVRANDNIVDSQTFVKLMEKIPPDQPVNLEIERTGPDGAPQTLTCVVKPITIGRIKEVLFDAEKHPNGSPPKPVVVGVFGEAAKQKLLARGDTVLAVNGNPVSADEFHELVKNSPGQTFQLTIRRPPIMFGLVKPELITTVSLRADPVRAIGVTWAEKTVFHRVPPARVLPEAIYDGYRAVAITVETLVELITGSVSPQELGGPLLIYQATTAAAEEGYWRLFTFTAFISANLCVFNLLPLPVLDGGLLFYLLIEAIRRKPIDIKVLERIQQAGLFLIIGLLLYVTYNDIVRYIKFRLP